MSGKICEICKNIIEENDEIISCPDCGREFHKKCWRLTGKCCVNEECRQKASERKEVERNQKLEATTAVGKDKAINETSDTSNAEDINASKEVYENQVDAYIEAIKKVKEDEKLIKKKSNRKKFIILIIAVLLLAIIAFVTFTIVTSCDECKGSGKVQCTYCNEGKIKCETCEGTGKSTCTDCSGIGIISCKDCVNGVVTSFCSECHGAGKDYHYYFIGNSLQEYTTECWFCNGTGFEKTTCKTCGGSGTTGKTCSKCSGTGKQGLCSSCSGTGKSECSHCEGTEKISCPVCNGTGKKSKNEVEK